MGKAAMTTQTSDKGKWLQGLILPFFINAVAGALCIALFGVFLGWTATTRANYPAWIGNGLPFVQFMAVAFLVNRLFRSVAERLNAAQPAQRGMPRLALQLVSVLIYFSFLGSSVSVVFGESVGAVLAASGIVGLAVGFAIRGLLSDIFSGIALHLDSSITPGDWLDVSTRGGQRSGRLVDIHWRAVVIADTSENLVYIPNSEFATATIINRSQPTTATEYGTSLPVSSEYDRMRVTEVLGNALDRVVIEGLLLDKPKPYIRVGGIEAGIVTYKMFYCIDPNQVSPLRAQSAVLGYSMDFLKASGIRFRPIREIEYKRPTPPGSDRSTELDTRLRVLADVPLLAVLSPSQLAELANDSHLTYFAAGEQVMRSGEDGDSMVVVLEGRLNVMLEAEEGLRHVATLWPGECAGEMSLLTGSPRSATVQAATAATLLEVPKAALTPILQANPPLVERIAATIDRRTASSHWPGQDRRRRDQPKRDGGLVSKIRTFFRM